MLRTKAYLFKLSVLSELVSDVLPKGFHSSSRR
jgi:hypothetical protein